MLFLGAFCDRTEKDQIHFITSYVILCKFSKYSNLLTFAIFSVLCAVFFFSLVMKTKRRVVMDTSSIYVRGEENLGEWKPRGISLIDEHQAHLDKLERIQEVKDYCIQAWNAYIMFTNFVPGKRWNLSFCFPKESNEGTEV